MSRPPNIQIKQTRMDDSHSEELTFSERQKAHFVDLLREKWECQEPGHAICVPTEDGQHFQLSERNLRAWVDALCAGEATTSRPPEGMFSLINKGAVWNRANGTMVLEAVSIAPSRRDRSSMRSPSISSPRTVAGTAIMSTWPSSGSSQTSSTGAPGPGYLGGRAIRWLGEKTLDAVQDVFILKRANSHLSTLKKWEKRPQPKLDGEERDKVYEMLGDALEISRPCYPARINKSSYEIGREVQQWLHSYPDLPQTGDTFVWLLQVQICLIPLLLARIAREDPLAGDLAFEILEVLLRVPLALQGTDITATVIRLLARELAYSKCTYQHAWLGVDLLRIVEMSLRMRELTSEELKAIRELAARREEQQSNDSRSRPWEVALFALCASQDLWFKDVVLGIYGMQSLLSALDQMLSKRLSGSEVDWEDVALTLRALAFLSEHEWVASAVEPGIFPSLLGVFRRSIPERWFCIRFWAMDTIRNIVSHRPQLVWKLLKENAAEAFATLTAAPLPGPKGVTTSRLLEDYKREASKRAEELSTYMKRWTEWTPDALPRLEPVSITRDAFYGLDMKADQ